MLNFCNKMKKLIKLNNNLIKFNGKLIKITTPSFICKFGTVIQLTDSAEQKPLNMKLYGWSKQDGEPSPDNPAEIESAGMTYYNFEGYNLLNVDPVFSKYKQLDGTYKLTAVELFNTVIPFDSEKMSNTHKDGFYFMCNIKLEDADEYAEISVGTYDGRINNDFYTITVDSSLDSWYNNNAHYFDVNKGDTGIRFIDYSGMRDDTVFYLQEIMIIDFNVYTDGDYDDPSEVRYEPYTNGKTTLLLGNRIKLGIRGKNLFHITKKSDCNKEFDKGTKRIILPGDYVVGLSSNNYLTNLKDAVVNESGGSFTYEQSKSGYGIAIGVACEHGKTYTYSRQSVSSNASVSFYDADGTFITYTYNNPFTVPENAKYTVFILNNSSTTKVGNTVSACNIQIEEGTDVTAYESYRIPQSTAIATPNGLLGIPVPSNTAGITYTDADGQAWIADEIDLERGKYVQRVWKGELDGSNDEDWRLYNNVPYQGFLVNILPEVMSRYTGFCNSFNVETYAGTNEAVWFGVNNKVLFVKCCRFYDELLADKGLSNFKAHLAANPLTVMTYLDTPIERDLTDAELAEYTQLYSYKPTTLIENDSGCWMDVTYVVDTET